MRWMLIASLFVSAVAAADWDTAKHTARAAARTASDAVVDTAKTVGETGKAAWHGGKPAASRAWHENTAQEKRDLRDDAAATRAARHP